MSELSARIQNYVIILCTSLYAARQDDEIIHAAADILCQDLRRQLSGRRPSDRYFRAVTKLGQQLVDGGHKSIADVQSDEILMRYDAE